MSVKTEAAAAAAQYEMASGAAHSRGPVGDQLIAALLAYRSAHKNWHIEGALWVLGFDMDEVWASGVTWDKGVKP